MSVTTAPALGGLLLLRATTAWLLRRIGAAVTATSLCCRDTPGRIALVAAGDPAGQDGTGEYRGDEQHHDWIKHLTKQRHLSPPKASPPKASPPKASPPKKRGQIIPLSLLKPRRLPSVKRKPTDQNGRNRRVGLSAGDALQQRKTVDILQKYGERTDFRQGVELPHDR